MRLVAGGGQAGRRVEVLRGRPAVDRQCVCGKSGGVNDRDARQRGQDLPVGLIEQLRKLGLEPCDVGAQTEPALDLATEAPGAELGVRRRQQPPRPPDPEAGVVSVSRPGERASSDRSVGARPANATAHAKTARPDGFSSSSTRP